jgi:hypothetical protein
MFAQLMNRLAILCIALTVSSCTVPPVEKASEPANAVATKVEAAKLSERERAVIRAMLEYEAQGHKGSKPVIVLSADSSADMLLESLGDDDASDMIDVSAIRSFRQANSRGHVWPKDLDRRYDLHFLTSAQSKEIWKDEDGWDRFYRLYPKAYGHTTISRVGFSADGRLALIYRGCQSDWLAGRGQIYVLRYERGRWKVTSEHVGGTWVS